MVDSFWCLQRHRRVWHTNSKLRERIHKSHCKFHMGVSTHYTRRSMAIQCSSYRTAEYHNSRVRYKSVPSISHHTYRWCISSICIDRSSCMICRYLTFLRTMWSPCSMPLFVCSQAVSLHQSLASADSSHRPMRTDH